MAEIRGITVNEDNTAIEAAKAWRAKKELKKRIARELLEQCASNGFTYSDVEQICEYARIGAKDQAFIHPHEEKS
jgi:hypothetical protein